MRTHAGWMGLGALTLVLAVPLWRQHRQIVDLQVRRLELAAQPLRPPRAPAPKPEAPSRQAQAEEFAALAAEREQLRLALQPAPTPPPAKPKPSSEWSNAGRLRPVDTLHTVIWAAVNGEIGELRTALALDAPAQAAADALFASLSPGEQAEYGDPATVIAVLLSGQMPLDLRHPEVIEQTHETPQRVRLRVRTRRGSRAPQEKTYSLSHDGSGWRVLVPAAAVESYRRMLVDG